MSNRFHNKFHRHNHHTNPTDRDGLYPDSAYDPIASREAPFQGEFYSEGDLTTTGSVSARFGIIGLDGVFNRNVTIKGNLDVQGTTTTLDTIVNTTSAMSITNLGTGPALTVTQAGYEPIAHFIDANGDDIIFANNGFVGLGVTDPSQKLTVVGNISAKRYTGSSDPADIGFGHIFNDGNTITQGILSVTSNAYLSADAHLANNLFVNNRTLYVSAGPGDFGRVGINTLLPNVELAVAGSTYVSTNSEIEGDLTVNTNSYLKKSLYVQNKGLVALSGTDGITRVGINTLTPNVELSIKGALSATNNLTVNGGITADGNLYNKGLAKIDGEVTLGTVNRTFDSTSARVVLHDWESGNAVRYNIPNDRIWDTQAEFLSSNSLTVNKVPVYTGPNTLAISPITISGSTVIASNSISAATFASPSYTSDAWNSTYVIMSSLSAVWQEAAAQAGTGGAFNLIKAVSGTWDNTYVTVKTLSGRWDAVADAVVLRTGDTMTGTLNIKPTVGTTSMNLTGDVNLTGVINIFNKANAPEMSITSDTSFGHLEIGGLSGGYLDLKSPFNDDFDLRLAHFNNTSFLATSGDFSIRTGTTLSSLTGVGTIDSTRMTVTKTGNIELYNTNGTIIDLKTNLSNDFNLRLANYTQENTIDSKGKFSIYTGPNATTGNFLGLTILEGASKGGNVGINTATPATQLHVVGNVYTTGTLSAEGRVFIGRQDTNSEGGEVVFKRASDNADAIGLDILGNGIDPRFRVYSINRGTEIFTAQHIFGEGSRFGINTVSPTTTLHVAGSARFDGDVFLRGNIGSEVASVRSVFESGIGGRMSFFTSQSNSTATERMRIDGSGFVNIGPAAAAAAQLHVRGGIRTNTSRPANASANVGYAFGTFGNTGLFSSAGTDLNLLVSGSEKITVNSTGVGVNTTNPQAALHVSGEIWGSALVTGNIADNLELLCGTNWNNQQASIVLFGNTQSTTLSGGIGFFTGGNGSSTRLFIDKNGATTISGATTVNGTLSVSGTFNGNTIQGRTINITNTQDWAGYEARGLSGGYIDIGHPDTNDFNFRIISSKSSSGTITNNVQSIQNLNLYVGGTPTTQTLNTIFTTTGRVGIGTGDPQRTLHVNGTGCFTGTLSVDGLTTLNGSLLVGRQSTTEGAEIQLARASDNTASLFIDSLGSTTNPRFRVYSRPSGSAGSELFTALSAIDGPRFGIGTGDPQETLHVYGTGYFTETLSVDGVTTLNGNQILKSTGWANTEYVGQSGGYIDIRSPYNSNEDFDFRIIHRNVDNVNEIYSAQNLRIRSGTNYPESAAHTFSTNGNFGIGTFTPTEKLHVVGNTFLNGIVSVGRQDTASEGGEIRLNRASDNSNHISLDVIGSGNEPRFRIFRSDGSGEILTANRTSAEGVRVGISKLTPQATLDVGGDIIASGLTTGNVADSLELYSSAPSFANPNCGIVLNASNTGFPRGIEFKTGGTTNRLTIDSTGVVRAFNNFIANGNIGIGTDAPTEKLHVVGDIYATNNVYTSGSTGGIAVDQGGTGGLFEQKSAGSGISGNAAYMTFHRPLNHAVRFGLDTDNQLKVGGWSMGNVAYRILHEGLSNPSLNGIVTINNGNIEVLGTNGTQIDLKSTSSNDFNLRLAHYTGENNIDSKGIFRIYTGPNAGTGNALGVTILQGIPGTRGGFVGINTATPAYQLDVSGDARVNGALGVAGAITQGDRVKPPGWGGGVTTWDVFADGGTIGAGFGSSSTINAWMNSAGYAYFAGNVGIGVNPAYKLHVANGDVGITNGNVNVINTTSDGRIEVKGQNTSYIDLANTATGDFNLRLLTHSSENQIWGIGGLKIYTGTIQAGVFNAMFTSTGRLGIGTDNPQTTLHVNGTTTSTAYAGGSIALDGANLSNVASVEATNLTNTYLLLKHAGSVNDFALIRQVGGSNAYHLAIDLHDDELAVSGTGQTFSVRNVASAGTGGEIITPIIHATTNFGSEARVGIGTSFPVETLHVKGEIAMEEGIITNRLSYSLPRAIGIASPGYSNYSTAYYGYKTFYTRGFDGTVASGEAGTLSRNIRFWDNYLHENNVTITQAFHSAYASIVLLSDGTLWGRGRVDFIYNRVSAGYGSDFFVHIAGKTANYGSIGTKTISYFTVNDPGTNLDNLTIAVQCTDDTCHIWGENAAGQFGDNTTTDSIVPKAITPPAGKTIAQISVGGSGGGETNTLIRMTDGTLYGCGYNGYGQLGTGNTTLYKTFTFINIIRVTKIWDPTIDRTSNISCRHTRWISTAASDAEFALGFNSSLMAAGYNGAYQLGDGTNVDKRTFTSPSWYESTGLTPSQRLAIGWQVEQFVCGGDGAENGMYVLVSTTDATSNRVYAWGYNKYGRIGNGDAVNQSVPVRVSKYVSRLNTDKTAELVNLPQIAKIFANLRGPNTGNSFGVIDFNGNLYTAGYYSCTPVTTHKNGGYSSTFNYLEKMQGLYNIIDGMFYENGSDSVGTIVLDGYGNVWGWGNNAYQIVGGVWGENAPQLIPRLLNPVNS